MPAPDLLRVILRPLNRLDLPYMITGAVAAIIYGEPRLTHDVDVVLKLGAADSGRIAEAFPSHAFYAPPIEAIEAESARPRFGHFNLVHLESGLKADIYIAGDDPLHEWAFPRRVREAYGDEVLWVAPIEYVIVRKLEYYRDSGAERHLRDIEQMLRVSADRVDRPALDHLISGAGVGREWRLAEARRR